MVNNTKVARELGYLDIAQDDILDAFDTHGLPPEKVVILCTGSQGEPLSALARMANGDHKTVKVEKGDTVIIAASPVPGNEKAVSRVINRLSRAGCDVVHKGNADVHVSGHASSEELKLMLNLTKPEFVMPIHGETRHLFAHSKLAQAVGIDEENIFVMENGDVLEIDEEYAELSGRVPSGVVYVDGVTVGDVGQVILRDRQHMSQDGLVSVVVAIDAKTGKTAGEPQIITRGIVIEDGTDVMTELRARLTKALAKTGREGVTDSAVVKRAIRESISQFLWERTRSRPMVVPVVMEV
jgi:ribonuclease J